jgi:hypothetical protein
VAAAVAQALIGARAALAAVPVGPAEVWEKLETTVGGTRSVGLQSSEEGVGSDGGKEVASERVRESGWTGRRAIYGRRENKNALPAPYE